MAAVIKDVFYDNLKPTVEWNVSLSAKLCEVF